MISIPKFKSSLTPVGNSKAFIVPAKVREDHGVEENTEYWVEIRLHKIEGGAQ